MADIAEVKQKRYFRYICSGFSLIEFYLVTVLEKANVALPPLQVKHFRHHGHQHNQCCTFSHHQYTPLIVFSTEDPQASLLLVIWRLLLSLLSSYLLLRCIFAQKVSRVLYCLHISLNLCYSKIFCSFP